jgi:hypothetical protein
MATDAEQKQTKDESAEGADQSPRSEDAVAIVDMDEETRNSMSQEELKEQDELAHQQQLKESKRKVGPFATAAMVVLVAIGLLSMYLSTTVIDDHPLVVQSLSVIGVVNLVLAFALIFRKNWARSLVLAGMPITMFIVFLNLTLISAAKYVLLVLCVVELLLLFRQPILDEYDAPRE